jgi:peptidoglycan/xylan/chitin deacetylase (PgdA/CDA1 family)
VSTSDTPEHVLVALSGLPPEWADRNATSLDLQPGETRQLILTIDVPRIPQSAAGELPVVIQAGCQDRVGSVVSFPLHIEVEAYSAFFAELSSEQQNERIRYKFRVANRGNHTDTYFIDAHAGVADLKPRGEQALQLAAGRSRSLELFQPIQRRPWVGKSVDRSVAIRLVAGSGETQTFRHANLLEPRLPTKQVWAAVAVLPILCLLLFWGARLEKPVQARTMPVDQIPSTAFVPMALQNNGRAYFPENVQPVSAALIDREFQPTPFVALSPTPIISPTPRPTDTRPDGKVVYLTFDDGPHKIWTPLVLELLARYDAKATFFVVGLNVNANPSLTERIWSEGHGLANHTWSHADLSYYNWAGFTSQLRRTDELLGEMATPCLRPPYGSQNPQVKAFAADLGMQMVMWDIDPQDWSQPGSHYISQTVIRQVFPNAIVLLHDGGGNRAQTLDALELILADLAAKGYSFEPVCR